MKTVGVLGGGQLAWMLAIAAEELGVPLVVWTDEAQAPVRQVSSARVVTEVAALLSQVDACLFENEWADLSSLRGPEFLPDLATLAAMVDKYQQRQTLQALGLPTPDFRAVNTANEVSQAGHDLGYPLVLKSRRYGYDGKGTAIAPNENAALEAWQKMGTPPAIAEAYVPYQAELALIAARNATGEIRFYPLAHTQQQDQVCRRILLPSPDGNATAAQAIAQTLLEHWQFVGVCGLEFFWEANGRLSLNEVAPRVHNSGHGTIEACVTSQFAQAIRIAAGLPLGDTALRV
ncbi:MAG: ATP-grasp domain-containing protein, partial [Pseudanabaenaceae cyanobacterium]